MATNLEKDISRRWTTKVNYMLQWMRVSVHLHLPASPEQYLLGCSWIVLIVLIKAIAFRSTFGGVQNIIGVELLSLVWTVLGRDGTGTLTKHSMSLITPAYYHVTKKLNKVWVMQNRECVDCVHHTFCGVKSKTE